VANHGVRLLLLFAVACDVSAQAWLFPKGEGTVSLSYQNVFVRDHVWSTGDAHDVGHILSHAVALDVDYSLTDRLAVSVMLPYVASKYYGPAPHQLPIDNGSYNTAFQDFTTGLRYNLSRRPVVLTPFFKAVIPSHNYQYFAHSAAGRDQREFHVGTNFGRRLNPVALNAFVQARYSFAFVERVLGIAPNRSDAEFQVGYFLTPRLSFLGTGQWMHTHSGVDLIFGAGHGGLNSDQWPHHDQIARASLLDVGGGAAFAINGSLEIFLSVARSVEGRNGHLHASVVTVGLSRTFGSRFERVITPAVDGGPAPQRALVCACAKTK
jgi:hypothetical protein